MTSRSKGRKRDEEEWGQKLREVINVRPFSAHIIMFGSSKNSNYRKLQKDATNFLSNYLYVFRCMYLLNFSMPKNGRCACKIQAEFNWVCEKPKINNAEVAYCRLNV